MTEEITVDTPTYGNNSVVYVKCPVVPDDTDIDMQHTILKTDEDDKISGDVASIQMSTSQRRAPRQAIARKRVRSLIRFLRKTRTKKTYYKERNVEKMRAEHVAVEGEHSHADNFLVNYLSSLVFGGVDGIITSFAVVAAIAGAGYSTFYILAIGIANLIADGLSMGLGDYLSSASEIEFATAELKREEWEYDNYKEGEEQEMIEIFKDRGMSLEDAEIVIKTTSKYKDLFCNEMMIHELGLTPPSDEDSPIKKGVMTFVAFIVCGVVPLVVYMFVDLKSSSSNYTFYISIVMTAASLFTLGALKSITSFVSWFRSGIGIMICGCIAAGAAFAISAFANHIVNTDDVCTNGTISNSTV